MRENAHHAVTDPGAVRSLIAANPWATLVSATDAGIVASHYPVLLEDTDDPARLSVLTHVGRPDEEHHRFGAHEVLLIVAGPHGYISPSWYSERATRVPTWNFSVAHCYGTPVLLEAEENLRVLRRLVRHFERDVEEPAELDAQLGAQPGGRDGRPAAADHALCLQGEDEPGQGSGDPAAGDRCAEARGPLQPPGARAGDGAGAGAARRHVIDQRLSERLRAAVAARRQEMVRLTQELVRERSLVGAEEGAQRLVAQQLSALGFAVQRVEVEPPSRDADQTWGYPPADYRDRACVVGRIGGAARARSLHLSGHVDVVPVDPGAQWQHDPWAGEISDGRIWGRGAGDMKAGIAAYLTGVAAFLEVCGAPAGDLLFSSVIEEECTGNGMKAVLAAGHDADGTLIGEPSALALMHAGAGVVWARLIAHSGGAHPGFSTGSSSSMALLRALDGLRALERRLNQHPREGAGSEQRGGEEVFFAAHEHPFRLNVGGLSGGVWPSSEPARAEARIRLGFGLSLTPTGAQQLIAEAVHESAPEVEVAFEGFRAPAYCDDLEHDLAAVLSASHELLHDSPPARQVLPATTDARSVSGPCVCYGPLAGAIHATDEWVDIDSAQAVAAAIALTIAGWQREDPRD